MDTSQSFKSQPNQSTVMHERTAIDASQSEKASKSKASPYTRIFQLASTNDRLIFLCGVISSLASGTVLPLMTLVFGHFVKIFTEFALGTLGADVFRGQINHYALYFVYLFIAKLGLSYISMVSFTITSTNITSRIRRSYLRALLSQNVLFHEKESSTGAVALALTSSCNAIQSGLADKCGLALQEASMLATAFIVAFASVWQLTLVVATVIPATVIVVGVGAVFDSKLEEKSLTINATAATHADELIRSVRTARALRATMKLLDRYKNLLDESEKWGKKRAPIYGTQVAVYMFGMYVIYALACWYGIRLYSRGEISDSGQVITTLFCIIIGTTSFSRLAGYSAPFLKIQSASTELFRVIDKEQHSEPSKGVERSPLSISDNIFSLKLTFKDVGFSYPLRPNTTIFDGLSLSIPAGKVTALVGPSGCGKSTVVGILERWYEPNKGEIDIGGVKLTDIPLDTLRENIGLVQQEPFLFSTTILENIIYGLPTRQVDLLSEAEKLDRVRAACKEANAHDFIEELPDGYNSFVGNRGTLLSGGQKQRIAIARAIIKNPKILILDEATSALDANAEKIVQNALDRASQGRTTITIAHRLSTIRNADQIVVLDHGKAMETGTHEELSMIKNGKYKHLLEAQETGEGSAPPNALGSKEAENVHDEVLKPAQTVQQEKGESESPEARRQTRYSTVRALMKTLYDQRNQWFAYTTMFILAVIGGAVFPLQAYLYAQLVNTFQLTGSSLVSRGNFWALMFTVLAIVTGIAYFGIAALGLIFGQRVTQYYRFSYLKSMMAQPISFFDDAENASGTLTARLDSNPESMQSLAGPNLGVIVTVMTALISSVILSLAIGWKLSLVAVFAALPFIFGAGLVHESMENNFEEKTTQTFETSNSFATECVSAIRTVNSLTMENLVDQRYGDLLREHGRRTTRYAFMAMAWFALSESLDFPCMALAFWYGGRLLSTGEYSTTQFFIVFVAIILGVQSMGQFFAHAADISKGTTAANSIFSLQEAIPKDHSLKQTFPDLQTSDNIAREKYIEFREVVFAYPGRKDRRVLNHLSLTVKRGQYIALVGPSGCGKSTVVGLIERFYDINGGQILMSGIDTRELDTEDIRKNIALVCQEPFLYQGTIRENILMACDRSIGEEELEMIAKQAQIYDLITSLPEGFETQVGAAGTALSGGQKQRVAIARAIAQDAPILLLDEATSALDSESERLVQDALREAGKGRSVIAIAHRLSTIRDADIIYVMKEGYVAEEGTYDELLKRKGIFHAMVSAQTVDAQH